MGPAPSVCQSRYGINCSFRLYSSNEVQGTSLMARAWGVFCDCWRGSHFAFGEKVTWTGQVLSLATLLAGSGNPSKILPTYIQAVAGYRSASVASPCGLSLYHADQLLLIKENKRELQDFSWNTSQDKTQWWDSRHHKRNSSPPAVRLKESGEALWLHNSYKSARVDSQLAAVEVQNDLFVPAASPGCSSSDLVDQLVGPGLEKRLTPESVKKLCQQGQVKAAVEILEFLVQKNSGIDNHIFYSVLKECVAKKDLILGDQVHALAVKVGFGSDKFLCSHLIRMYAGHGKLQDAMDVFRGVTLPDNFMWSSIISAHVKQGEARRAIGLYHHMRAMRIKPDGHVLVAALQACAAAGDLQSGKQVHHDVFTSGMDDNMYVCNCLVDMYAKCSSLKDARRVFDGLSKKTVVTWSSMIAAYARVEGMGQEALSLYNAMHNEGITNPNAVTFVSLLQACANVGVSALEKGKQFHSLLKDQKLEPDVSGSLVNMYVKCGSLDDARIVFDRLGEKDVVTWNAMLSGYAQQEGMGQEALGLYHAMHDVAPSAVTFVCLLQACANVGVPALDTGKQLHSQLRDRGLESDVVVGGSLVNMYVKCGGLEGARRAFDGLVEKDVVTWTAMIAGYAQREGLGLEALSLYNAMQNEGIVALDAVTFVCLLQACANMGVSALEKGKQLHLHLKDRGLESDVDVGCSLVNMYVKCGSLKDARDVFDGLRQKSVVTWNAMLSGYAQQEGMAQEALNIYSAMRSKGMATPNALTYVCLLQACASVGALQLGKQLHSDISEGGFESNVLIGTSLVKMYAKCGRLDVSREVFDTLPIKDLATWSALLKGYAEHGEGDMAIQRFEELLKHGIQPNDVTYTCLFTACSHAGLVDEGQQYFETMLERHGVEPNVQHYSCMVDLLSRSGQLYKAEQLLRTSGLAGNAVSWTALLSACKIYGDAELGRRCFEHLLKLEPTDATPYVLLGSIYAKAGRWDEVDKVESLRKAAGAKKVPAKACIEVKEEVHEFTVGEERSDVAATLRNMNTRVKKSGHVPQTQLVLRAVSEQEKEDALCGHAEKLALAYGLMHTPAGSTLVVTKNLRMCNDCHSSTKVMSRLEKREIVVRDGHKVHRFQNGICSCHDRP